MRIQSFSDFWPVYLSQHSNLYCRIVHFIGTTLFFLSMLLCCLLGDWKTGAGYCIVALTLLLLSPLEKHQNGAPVLLVSIAALIFINPWTVVGIVVAYAFAWVGHFLIEHNRPATFTYPLWSLFGDFRMWWAMCLGELWEKDISQHWKDTVLPNV